MKSTKYATMSLDLVYKLWWLFSNLISFPRWFNVITYHFLVEMPWTQCWFNLFALWVGIRLSLPSTIKHDIQSEGVIHFPGPISQAVQGYACWSSSIYHQAVLNALNNNWFPLHPKRHMVRATTTICWACLILTIHRCCVQSFRLTHHFQKNEIECNPTNSMFPE